ncbi:MAG: PaaI family thioesterase [Planctomycetales bacterium]|nr:PaaI family thioesterase [Planctomycetales bacterium]
MCFVCGLGNPSGLKARFFELENKSIVALFDGQNHLQGYPGRLHGGMAAMILDETIGRASCIEYGETVWGVTIGLETRFRQPVPLDTEVMTVASIVKDGRRSFVGSGRILLPDGSVAVEAMGKYLRLPIEEIADFDVEHEQWHVSTLESDPTEIELPLAAE